MSHLTKLTNSNEGLLIERLFEALVNGDRVGSRAILDECANVPTQRVLMNLFWPTHELIERMHRQDQMTTVAYQLATRLLRMLVDQAAAKLEFSTRNGETIFACCGQSQGEELAGQMACDLLEAAGFEVCFTGGGIPSDEVLEQVQSRQPNYLVLFASAASDLPGVRSLIDQLREINAVNNTRIAVGGGVFNRAEGLAEEMGCFLCAETPLEMVELLTDPNLEQLHAQPVAQSVAKLSQARRVNKPAALRAATLRKVA
jgi:MerR family transcriptional regulator, light-induced transcriptional regulator